MEEVAKEILEILKYTVPSGIVFATAYFMLRKFFDEQRKVEILKAKANAKKDTLPTRLQAYERLILLLERIEPANLILRVHVPAMSARVFHRELLKTVKGEFEHNMAQQLYVSNDCWNNIIASKNAVIQLINLSEKNLKDGATGLELSNALFEIVAKAGVSPTANALVTLKNEARQLL